MNISEDIKLDYQDVLLVPKASEISSRTEVELCGCGELRIIAANMDGVGTFNMSKELAKYGIHTALVKHYSIKELVDFYVSNPETSPYAIYSLGIGAEDMDKIQRFSDACASNDAVGPHYICLDIANGYSKGFLESIQRLKKNYPQYQLIAGNVCTPSQARAVIESGADYVKVGIGPGAVCTTRIQTGVGFPQLSAVIDCAKGVHFDYWYSAYKRIANHALDNTNAIKWLDENRPNGPLVGKIIADGGCTCPGDVLKAFGAGADAVMLGSMFAGHNEGLSNDNISIVPPGKISFYGMASKTAQDKHNGGVAEYRSSEGKEVTIPYKGLVRNTVLNLLGGLRSGLTYVGHTSLSSFIGQGDFVRVNHVINNSLS